MEARKTGEKAPHVRPACGNCKWWDNSVRSLAHSDNGIESGRCIRNPPGFDDRTGHAVWPITEEDDRCGEFLPSQDAIENAVAEASND